MAGDPVITSSSINLQSNPFPSGFSNNKLDFLVWYED
tara:strand:+ start:656 stop:766 length:111 start_codon:yes stop_codon:yes gene_type:complete